MIAQALQRSGNVKILGTMIQNLRIFNTEHFEGSARYQPSCNTNRLHGWSSANATEPLET